MATNISRDANTYLRPTSPAPGIRRMHRITSHESLTAHPLLPPDPSPLSATGTSETTHNQSDSDAARSVASSTQASAPRYVPYTPRQTRVTAGVATGTSANTPISVSVSPQQTYLGGATSATSRLQLQNLKAIGQSHGADANTLGWAMLEELVGGSDKSPVWSEIWNMLAVGKAMILLPTEQLNSHEVISPDFMKDHVAFCIGPSRNNSPLVTLSGLRGIIDGDRIVFQSIVSTSSKTFKLLANPIDRSATLLSLPPLPRLSSGILTHPEVPALDFISSLPLPPRSSSQHKPPLPPRPGSKVPATTQGVSRLSNPFASFFSKTSVISSPSSAPQSLPEVTVPTDHAVEVSAFTISKSIRRKDVLKALAKCAKAEIKNALSDLPSWVVECSQRFSENYIPLSSYEREPQDNVSRSQVSSEKQSVQSLSTYNELAEDMSEAFQQFYDSLDKELRVEWPAPFQRHKEKLTEDEVGKQEEDRDQRIRNAVEKVERILSVLLYDRLFRPSNSDDASHDEALSSRIAALNMLELNLGHLGIDVGQSGVEVERIVKACGEMISQLEVARCPADKAAILVASHQIVVDGLSQLPPLRLRTGDQIEDDRTPLSATLEQGYKVSPKKDGVTYTSALTASAETKLSNLFVDGEKNIVEDNTGGIKQGNSINQELIDEAGLPPHTPARTASPSKVPTPVSSDILLPLIIFSVVKSNPPQLVSHLLFTQRFRNQSFGGEEGYCLVNLMAVVEFLENVDLGALGLKDCEKKVISTADLTPIPLAHRALSKDDASVPISQESLRGRVGQQVDAIAGSANRVLSGVVDSGVGVLRALLPTASGEQVSSGSGERNTDGGTSWNRPGFGLLRRETGFSIAGLTASLPGSGNRERARSFASSHHPEDEGQEMIESQPNSVKNFPLDDAIDNFDGEESEPDGTGSDEEEEVVATDARSIRSFENMMNRRGKQRLGKKERMSLSDRLANMSRLTKSSQDASQYRPNSPPLRSSSLAVANDVTRFDATTLSRPPSPMSLQHALPPNRRFLECSPDDLRISEIPELLREYRRLADILSSMGAFDEHING